MKTCFDCKLTKPFSEYHTSGKGFRLNCKSCRSIRDRSDKLLRLYNITAEQYLEMLRKQNGTCKICGQQETRRDSRTGAIRFLAVDHDHSCCPGEKTCGQCVRSLLCSRCNLIIGMADDNVNFLVDAIIYLKNWEKIDA